MPNNTPLIWLLTHLSYHTTTYRTLSQFIQTQLPSCTSAIDCIYCKMKPSSRLNAVCKELFFCRNVAFKELIKYFNSNQYWCLIIYLCGKSPGISRIINIQSVVIAGYAGDTRSWSLFQSYYSLYRCHIGVGVNSHTNIPDGTKHWVKIK